MKLIYCFLTLFLFYNCQSPQKKKVSFSKESTAAIINDVNQDSSPKARIQALLNDLPSRELPLTSDNLDSLYENVEGEFLIKPQLKTKKEYLELFAFKKADSSGFYNVEERKFYPIFKLKSGNNQIIGCLVHFFESDIPGILLELHSFDEDFIEKDYLIAYTRYTFEISYEKDFKIDKEFTISLNEIITDYFDGSLEKLREIPHVTKVEEDYSLTADGVFRNLEENKP